jgi:hypothetical protein
MPEPPKKRLCLRCNDNKEYKDDDVSCGSGHDISLENYLFAREDERETKRKEDEKKNKPQSLLGNLGKLAKK